MKMRHREADDIVWANGADVAAPNMQAHRIFLEMATISYSF